MLTLEFPVVSSNLKVGYGIYGTADPYNASLPNNGALNIPGGVYAIPTPSSSGSTLASAKGYGSYTIVKYCLYLAASNPAMVTGPAPVYYTSETFTQVSGMDADAIAGATTAPSMVAGWLPLNTGSVAGVGIGSAVSATILNNNNLGSWVFIILSGFIPSAYLAAGAQGGQLSASAAATTAFSTTTVAPGSSPINKIIGYVVSTVSSNIGDVYATLPIF